MIAITRFRVAESDVTPFVAQAKEALAVLSERPGFQTADLGRNLDDPTLFTLTTRWQDVGSYRRALQGFEAKVTVVPLLSLALDEPSAYEDVEVVGPQQARAPGSPR